MILVIKPRMRAILNHQIRFWKSTWIALAAMSGCDWQRIRGAARVTRWRRWQAGELKEHCNVRQRQRQRQTFPSKTKTKTYYWGIKEFAHHDGKMRRTVTDGHDKADGDDDQWESPGHSTWWRKEKMTESLKSAKSLHCLVGQPGHHHHSDEEECGDEAGCCKNSLLCCDAL